MWSLASKFQMWCTRYDAYLIKIHLESEVSWRVHVIGEEVACVAGRRKGGKSKWARGGEAREGEGTRSSHVRSSRASRAHFSSFLPLQTPATQASEEVSQMPFVSIAWFQIMGLATIDSRSQKEHTEIHKIPKFGVNQASFHWDTAI